MKFVMYNDNQPGILTDAGVIDVGDLCPGGGQDAMVHLLTNYGDLKSQLETRAVEGTPVAGAQTAGAAAAPRQGPLYGRQLPRVRCAGAFTNVGLHQEHPQHSGPGRHRQSSLT